MALREIIKRAQGSPRVINILCDNALIAGVGYRKKPVNLKIVDRAISDYQLKKRPSLKRWATLPVAAVFVAACFFILSPYSGTLLSSLEDNYRQILGVTPARVEASVSAQENSLATIGLPKEAEAPELPGAAAEGESEAITPLPEVTGASPETLMVTLPIKTKPQPAKSVAEPPETQFPVVRGLKDGQTLYGLTREVYGRSDPRLVEWVKENNPWIDDVTKIPNGQEIVFPAPPEGTAVPVIKGSTK
jgi:general secretion pathway protein A